MKLNLKTLLLVFAAGAVSACAHVPRAPHPSVANDTMRAQYLADNPRGQFNDKIEHGEIAEGMNALEVLASWGLPDRRRQEKHHAHEESWFYLARDEYSRDYIVYEIVFEDRQLDRWYVMRGTAGSGGLFSSGTSGYAAFRDSRATRSAPAPDSAFEQGQGKR